MTLVEEQENFEKKKRVTFDKRIKAKLGGYITLLSVLIKAIDTDKLDFDSRDKDDEEPQGLVDGGLIGSNGTLVFENPGSDTFINAEVLLPQGEDSATYMVLGRHITIYGEVIGHFDPNPVFNSIIYNVEFSDGAVKQYGANLIVQSIYSIVDKDGCSQLVLDFIMDHATDDRTVTKADKYIMTGKGRRRIRKITTGWKLLI